MKKLRFVNMAFAILLMAFFTENVIASKITVPDDYNSIQQAVDAAAVGDLVYVRVGTYFENVTIDKSLTLEGEDKKTTLIDGGGFGAVVYITANEVNVKGITAINGEQGVKLINNYAISNVVISDCRLILNLKEGFHGGHVGGYIAIENCDISNNGNIGIYSHQFDNSIISNCEIAGNATWGILIGWCSNTEIANCILRANNLEAIRLDSTHDIIVEGNRLSENAGGITVFEWGSSYNNTIRNNIVSYNEANGIHVASGSQNNHIYHNDIISNGSQASDLGIGSNWDNGYPSGGNYWSDYTGMDENNDGIGDSPYYIDNNDQDNYPLVSPYNNSTPIINVINAPVDPLQINYEFSVSVDYTDDNLSGATFDWGNGDITTVAPGGDGSIISNYSYSAPGVYTLTVTLFDEFGESSTQAYQYIVVYDPYGGFVTGGGWIHSAPGAYAADPSLEGKASFGFVSKYKKGAQVPEGNTEFQFKAGDLNFKCTIYDWLVIAGSKAKFKGCGTINNTENYGFMVSAIDGAAKEDPDKFRIKIWDASGVVVYDNQMDADDDADPITTIGGGSIVVHDGKNNARVAIESTELNASSLDINEVKFYPNPTENYLNVELPLKLQSCVISIYEMKGRLVFQKCFRDRSRISLNLGRHLPGVYLMTVESDQLHGIYKFVKN